ncbi:unnamed protein product [Ceratitis capitata]|uniref:(Mediterranean fruit fly) hypothetical protein n=1 Tax=Ceratitis capitata TaxID=7213 RepID=A0A811U5Z4_CERCA|nr:unnamed protein product [Ceratitis capitata]
MCKYLGRPEPVVTWINGTRQLESGNGVSMGRHVTVNRLEVPNISRSALKQYIPLSSVKYEIGAASGT